jgi:hypothetical protein
MNMICAHIQCGSGTASLLAFTSRENHVTFGTRPYLCVKLDPGVTLFRPPPPPARPPGCIDIFELVGLPGVPPGTNAYFDRRVGLDRHGLLIDIRANPCPGRVDAPGFSYFGGCRIVLDLGHVYAVLDTPVHVSFLVNSGTVRIVTSARDCVDHRP